MPDRETPEPVVSLAVRAVDDPHAFAALCREWQHRVDVILDATAAVTNMGHRRQEAVAVAWEALLKAIQTNAEDPDFEYFARGRISTRVKTWMIRQWIKEQRERPVSPHPDPGAERGSLLDTEDDAFVPLPEHLPHLSALVEGFVDRIVDPVQRVKWTSWKALREIGGYSDREIADALALHAAGVPEADPTVPDSWEYAAARLRTIEVPGLPPPAPATWGGCVALFCSPSAQGAPYAPDLGRVRDSTSREQELSAWRKRTRRHFAPSALASRQK